jgi:hypothetical protein
LWGCAARQPNRFGRLVRPDMQVLGSQPGHPAWRSTSVRKLVQLAPCRAARGAGEPQLIGFANPCLLKAPASVPALEPLQISRGSGIRFRSFPPFRSLLAARS